jgi:hypothetical protein
MHNNEHIHQHAAAGPLFDQEYRCVVNHKELVQQFSLRSTSFFHLDYICSGIICSARHVVAAHICMNHGYELTAPSLRSVHFVPGKWLHCSVSVNTRGILVPLWVQCLSDLNKMRLPQMP